MKREAHCVKALYGYFGVDDEYGNWRDQDPEEVVRVVLQAAEDWARLYSVEMQRAALNPRTDA